MCTIGITKKTFTLPISWSLKMRTTWLSYMQSHGTCFNRLCVKKYLLHCIYLNLGVMDTQESSLNKNFNTSWMAYF